MTNVSNFSHQIVEFEEKCYCHPRAVQILSSDVIEFRPIANTFRDLCQILCQRTDLSVDASCVLGGSSTFSASGTIAADLDFGIHARFQFDDTSGNNSMPGVRESQCANACLQAIDEWLPLATSRGIQLVQVVSIPSDVTHVNLQRQDSSSARLPINLKLQPDRSFRTNTDAALHTSLSMYPTSTWAFLCILQGVPLLVDLSLDWSYKCSGGISNVQSKLSSVWFPNVAFSLSEAEKQLAMEHEMVAICGSSGNNCDFSHGVAPYLYQALQRGTLLKCLNRLLELSAYYEYGVLLERLEHELGKDPHLHLTLAKRLCAILNLRQDAWIATEVVVDAFASLYEQAQYSFSRNAGGEYDMIFNSLHNAASLDDIHSLSVDYLKRSHILSSRSALKFLNTVKCDMLPGGLDFIRYSLYSMQRDRSSR